MLRLVSILFPLIVVPFKTWFPLRWHICLSSIQKMIFDVKDTNILRVYVHNILYCGHEFKTVFQGLMGSHIFVVFVFTTYNSANKNPTK